VSIQSQGEDLEQFVSRIKEENSELNTKLISLGKEIHSFMQQVIVSNIKRPGSTGNLVRSIQFGVLGEGSFWIGDIDFLNDNAKYWRFLNYGKAGTGETIPGGGKAVPAGIFSPGSANPDQSSFRSGRWNVGGNSGGRMFTFAAKRPMPSFNYIEKSIFLLENRLEDILKSGTKTIFGSGFSMSGKF
jgi:hypothetical protein